MNESTFTPGGGQPGTPARAHLAPGVSRAVGSVAVRSLRSPPESAGNSDSTHEYGWPTRERQGPATEVARPATTSPTTTNCPRGTSTTRTRSTSPIFEYAATLAPDAARQRRSASDLTGRARCPTSRSRAHRPSTAPRRSSRCATRRAASARPRRPSTWVPRSPSTGAGVLLVDSDPQGALSVGLGVNPMELDLTVYNPLMERAWRPTRCC